MTEPGGEIVVYRSDDGRSQVQLRAVDGTVWLTQVQIAELYGTSVPNIVQIARRVLADGEVDEATLNSELIVQEEGSRQVRREIKIYNLDMVLAIGYRASSVSRRSTAATGARPSPCCAISPTRPDSPMQSSVVPTWHCRTCGTSS